MEPELLTKHLAKGGMFKPEKMVVVKEHFNLSKTTWPKQRPLIVDGQGKLVFKQGFSIMDCSHFELRNCIVFGGIKLTSSYPHDYGLHHITIRGCKILFSPSRGIFMSAARSPTSTS